MGYSRRKENFEIAEQVKAADQAISTITLGQLCARGMVKLEVACQRCPRKGRYRITQLIDRNGAGKSLLDVKELLAADCPKLKRASHFDRCGAYFPAVMRMVQP